MVKTRFNIFIDTSFLVASYKEDDSLHGKALLIEKEIKKLESSLVISNLVFIETVTVLSMRAGRNIAIKAGEYLLDKENISIIRIGEELEFETWKVFKEVKKKNMSFVDCASIAVMQAEGIDKFLTFDKDDFSTLRQKYSFSFF